MRQDFYQIALYLKVARERALERDSNGALQEFDRAIAHLRELPPDRVRDVLLAHAWLGRFQTLTVDKPGQQPSKNALESLHMGVSYARSTRDPLARAIAEECLAGLEATV